MSGKESNGGASGLVDSATAGAANAWISHEGIAAAIREAANGTGETVWRRDAVLLVAAVAKGKIAPRLYRGIGVGPEDGARYRAMKVGDPLDMNLSSWSTNRHQANNSAAFGDSHIIFVVKGARAYDVGAIGIVNQRIDEREWITDGHFVVTGIQPKVPREVVYSYAGSDQTIIALRQVSPWTSIKQIPKGAR